MVNNIFSWKDRNVFITGATGFLGSYLAKSLVNRGANVVALKRDEVPKSNLYRSDEYKEITFVAGELTDLPTLERVIAEYEIDTVFHIAAQAIVGVANRSPVSTFESNIKGTWSVLEACRKNPLVKRIVVASSDKAYGDQKQLPYDESMPLQGKHPYDVSKSCTDLLAQAYHNTYG
ncbi:MAG: NAD-dependent epimerase/dehydratase family protein, partial [Clostridiales bacterium]|nr:NAD-dependent epimerase/dehydratase family protein [Clostridiales bacterium]